MNKVSKPIGSTKEAVIKRLMALAKQRSCENETLFQEFITIYYSRVSIGDLSQRSVESLYAMVHSHWQMLQSRRAHQVDISVFNPGHHTEPWECTHTVIQLVVDDMPFLVDTIRMELNRMGLMTHFMIYLGGVEVQRESGGNIVGIATHAKEQANDQYHIEAPIYIEVDQQTTAKVLQIIAANVRKVIEDVRLTVRDWAPMQEQIQQLVVMYQLGIEGVDPMVSSEAAAYLQWLLNNHFTILGLRQYDFGAYKGSPALTLIPKSGLGVLSDESHCKKYRLFSEFPDLARHQLLDKSHCIAMYKTNTHATVHRRSYTDYVGIKRYNNKGEVIGECRLIGLYTSTAYNAGLGSIPLLRQKVTEIIRRSELPSRSHDGKDLFHILNEMPRDDFIQGTVDQLYDMAIGILHLQERRLTRLFVREDAYGRFVSCLVYLPRENFDSTLLKKMNDILMCGFKGLDSEFSTHFSSSILARVHFVIRVDMDNLQLFDVKSMEQELILAGKSWSDELSEHLKCHFTEAEAIQHLAQYGQAFSAAYREAFSAWVAVQDIITMDSLTAADSINMHFYHPDSEPGDRFCMKLFRLGEEIPLSDIVPMLENMSLRVINEQAYEVKCVGKEIIWLSNISLMAHAKTTFNVDEVDELFEQALKAVWNREADNDLLNSLILTVFLSWRQVSVLRGYIAYMKQAIVPYSKSYIINTLISYPQMAALLIDLFAAYFEPGKAQRDEEIMAIEERFNQEVDGIAELDQDKIMRRMLNLIQATVRTNYYQLSNECEPCPYLVLKFDSSKVPQLPLPVPKYDIFVYSPLFEGIHLRASKIARGGLRWSTRMEDYRTEVHDLMKAQDVKNSVIVPAGAKGGFAIKPAAMSEHHSLQEVGQQCYQLFISGLLDVVDNYEQEKIVTPEDTICYDDADPYIVVAADKGTATFSDIANAIAIERGYWLGDAFASGGETGYDHKKKAITARGAWLAGQRHFQDLGSELDQTEITVVGIGDMSGDVFGNGLLLSHRIKLLAAFNHRHIFIDPDPDPKASFAERQRLFHLTQSSWSEYAPKLISKGGGVFDRSAKSIPVSAQMRRLLQIDASSIVPNELIKKILQMSVDMLWNGGIGTFIKSSEETHQDAADKTNDSTRVNAQEVGATVICEGGNLGVTQLGRIAFERAGGRINTDFIDNSAGVDCSDHEVLIKILLNDVVSSGSLNEAKRNRLLARMTDEVCEMVLRHNYMQTRTISLAHHESIADMPIYRRLINDYESNHQLDREVNYLPLDDDLVQRQAEKKGLTRPELSVLLSHSKIILQQQLKKSNLIDDPFFTPILQDSFPAILRKRYPDFIAKHQLRVDILATQVANQVIDEMGITFFFRMQEETGRSIVEVVKAYYAVREIFHVSTFFQEIECYDHTIAIDIQYRLYLLLTRMWRRSTRWLLSNHSSIAEVKPIVDIYQEPIHSVMGKLSRYLLGDEREGISLQVQDLVAAGVDEDFAFHLSTLPRVYHLLNIVVAAKTTGADLYAVAKMYFTLADALELTTFRFLINEYPYESRWHALAKAATKSELDRLQCSLTQSILHDATPIKSRTARLNAWFHHFHAPIARWRDMMKRAKEQGGTDFSILIVAIKELANLAYSCNIDVDERDKGKQDDDSAN